MNGHNCSNEDGCLIGLQKKKRERGRGKRKKKKQTGAFRDDRREVLSVGLRRGSINDGENGALQEPSSARVDLINLA